MKAHEVVVGGAVQVIAAGLHQFQAQDHGQQTSEQKQKQESDQVLDSDNFVIGVKGKVTRQPGVFVLLKLQVEPLSGPIIPDAGPKQPADNGEKEPDS